MQFPANNQWDQLADQPLVAAMGQDRVWLTSMFDVFCADTSAKLVASYDGSLQALAALEKGKLSKLTLPIVATSWDCGFLFSGTPLISSKNPSSAMAGLLQQAEKDMAAKAVFFRKVQHTPALSRALQELEGEGIAGYQVFDMHQRAGLVCETGFEDWFTDNFSRKRRKEYRRLRNRLAEQGELLSLTWEKTMPVETWVEEFLELEAAGWKGQAGTAIACMDNQAAHLRQALRQMAQNGSLLFWKMTLDGKVIATMFGFAGQNQAWLGKMAFDETLSQYSPGVLLILDATKNLLGRKNIMLADSSAAPNHPMINNIWRNRISVGDYLIATPGTSAAVFNSIASWMSLRLKAREKVKAAYYKVQRIRKNANSRT
jgi:hypothetical protein